MGQQTRFFMNDADWHDFLSFVHEAEFTPLPQLIPAVGKHVPFSAKEISQNDERSQPYFYLLPKPLTLDTVVYQELTSDVTRHKLANYQSPVIEVSRCRLTDNMLAPGRIYFNMRARNESRLIALKAYQSLSRRIKKWNMTTEYFIPVGPKTEIEVERKLLVIRELGTNLRVNVKGD